MAEPNAAWERVRFGDVVRLVRETCKDPAAEGIERVIGLEHLEPGELRVRTWSDVVDGTTFTTRVRSGQVLFGKRRAYQKKVAVADFDAVCSGDIYVFESLDTERLLPAVLPFICLTEGFFAHAIGTSAGSLSPRTNWSSLAAYEFALPPMAEQRLLATTLLAIQNNHEALYHAAKQLDVAEAALLFAEFGEFNHGPLPKYAPLRSVANIQSGVAKGRISEPGTTIEVPYLRVANVKDGYLDLDDVQLITVEASRVDQFRLRSGDVLMTEGGDLDKLGRGTVWQGEVDGCIHQNHVFAVRPDADRLDPWYLAALARSPFGRGYFQKCAKRTSNLASVNKGELGQLPVPQRSLEWQRTFVQTWRALRHERSQLELREQKLRQLAQVLFKAERSS